MPPGDEHKGKQDPEMRFEREEPDESAGERRPRWQEQERSADQASAHEPVLPDQEVRENPRVGTSEQKPCPTANDGAYGKDIGRKRQSYPRDIGPQEGKTRE